MNKVRINIEDLFELDSAVIYNPDVFKSSGHVSIDSRTIKKNSIFVAIKGEKLDGHKFVHEVVKKGASAVIINKSKLRLFDGVNSTIVTVKDTTKSFGQLANIWRKKLSAKVISLTGSNGKTTTKEIISTLLSEKFITNKSIANNNNHIGVPLTIFSASEKDQALVLEHGTNHFGEIEYTAKIAQPDIALITNIGDSHLEFLKDREGVFNEKSVLFDYVDNVKGKILLNTDDPFLNKIKRKYENVVTYGFKGSPDIKGRIEGYCDDGKLIMSVLYKKINLKVVLPLLSEANARNFLAACAVAILAGLNKKDILRGTKKLKPAKDRLDYVDNNVNMLISDVYNSNPDSMKVALELMKRIKKYKNKIFIAGDMFELGKESRRLHRELACCFSGIKNLRVLTIGKNMKYLSDELIKEKIDAKHFSNREKMKVYLEKIDQENTVALVKGSRGMKMEEFVEIMRRRG